jgi:hypothetical protein
MDPITLSTLASVLLKAGPSLVRTVGGWFGSDSTGKAADSVASIVETVNGAINPADQQRVLEQKLAQLPPEQLVQLEGLKVQLQQFQLERDKAQMADQQAAHHEQQETIRNGDNATDEYVRQTRPLMARLPLQQHCLRDDHVSGPAGWRGGRCLWSCVFHARTGLGYRADAGDPGAGLSGFQDAGRFRPVQQIQQTQGHGG